MNDAIEISGALEHNLKNVDLAIPKRQLVTFTGVSGSGKSSLIFDTLYAESFRRFADASQVPVHLMGRSSFALTQRPKFSSIKGLPPALGLSQRQGVAGKLSTVGTVSGVADLLRVYFAAFGEPYCKNCDIPLRSMSFSEVVEAVVSNYSGKNILFIAPIAEKRKGAFLDEIERFRRFGFTKIRLNGKIMRLDGPEENLRLDARKLNTVELVVDAFVLREERIPRAERAITQAIDIARLVKVELFSGDAQSDSRSGSKSPEPQKAEIFNMSSACPQCQESAPKLDPRHLSHSSLGKCLTCEGTGQQSENLPADLFPCPSCLGSRISNEIPTVKVNGVAFRKLSHATLGEIREFASNEMMRVTSPSKATGAKASSAKAKIKVLQELVRLLHVHHELGIGHLSILRSGNSLSPGDLQRLRLSSLLANRLKGALYVLDEPCQGLTRNEVHVLLKYLRVFVNEGSSVLVVEHHPDFLKGSDRVFVMGPGAGRHGGELVLDCKGGQYDPLLELKHFNENVKSKVNVLLREAITSGPVERQNKRASRLVFKDIEIRNLKRSEIVIHQGAIQLLRGPSGAGKSTFMNLCLAPVLARHMKNEPSEGFGEAIQALPKDPFKLEKPAGFEVMGLHFVRPGSLNRSSRRTVAAALDLLPLLRTRFESLVSAQVLGLVAADFSWNSKGGQCEQCRGKGFLEFEQKYAPPIEVVCTSCNGAKLTRRSLLPRLRGKNFSEILDMSLEEASVFFENDRLVRLKIDSALEFGLGYVRMNQSMESLSGGEMQRLVLTLELKRSKVDGVWYLLTHPGTGLHLPDIKVLGELLARLKNRGASFVISENREEFAEFADFVVEF